MDKYRPTGRDESLSGGQLEQIEQKYGCATKEMLQRASSMIIVILENYCSGFSKSYPPINTSDLSGKLVELWEGATESIKIPLKQEQKGRSEFIPHLLLEVKDQRNGHKGVEISYQYNDPAKAEGEAMKDYALGGAGTMGYEHKVALVYF